MLLLPAACMGPPVSRTRPVSRDAGIMLPALKNVCLQESVCHDLETGGRPFLLCRIRVQDRILHGLQRDGGEGVFPVREYRDDPVKSADLKNGHDLFGQ